MENTSNGLGFERQLTPQEQREKEDFIELDTMMNRQILETARSFIFGSICGLGVTVLFYSRMKNRHWMSAFLAGGMSCAAFNLSKFGPWYWWSFNQWNAKSQQEREAMGEQGQAKFGNESPVKFPSSAFSEVDSTARLGDGRL